MLLWTLGCMYLLELMVFSGYMPKSGIAGSYGSSVFKFWVFYLFIFLFWLPSLASGILIPWPGVKPVCPAVDMQSLNHWTTREVLLFLEGLVYCTCLWYTYFYSVHGNEITIYFMRVESLDFWNLLDYATLSEQLYFHFISYV